MLSSPSQVNRLESRIAFSPEDESRKSLREERSRLVTKKEKACELKLKLHTTMDKVGIMVKKLGNFLG